MLVAVSLLASQTAFGRLGDLRTGLAERGGRWCAHKPADRLAEQLVCMHIVPRFDRIGVASSETVR